jgi:hypothetical protein
MTLYRYEEPTPDMGGYSCGECGREGRYVLTVIDWDRAYLEGAENGIDDIAVRAILAMALGIGDDNE